MATKTIFEAIVDAFASRLSASPALSGYIDKHDADPMPDSRSSSILVRILAAEPQQLGGIAGNPVDWVSLVEVQCAATTVHTVAVPTAVPPAMALVLAAYARLASTPDLGLPVEAGVFIGEPVIRFPEPVQAANRIAVCTLSYSVQHRTTSLNLE